MATALFIGFWVLLALVIVIAAIRGGRKGRPMFDAQRRGSRLALGVLVVLMVLVFGVGLPIVSSIDSAAKAKQGPKGLQLTTAEKQGRESFAEQCKQCHTLAASEAVAQVGPNLDQLRPNRALILDAINNGRARGNGAMARDLVVGKDAEDVANYVCAAVGTCE